jgi:hypothetical protein
MLDADTLNGLSVPPIEFDVTIRQGHEIRDLDRGRRVLVPQDCNDCFVTRALCYEVRVPDMLSGSDDDRWCVAEGSVTSIMTSVNLDNES